MGIGLAIDRIGKVELAELKRGGLPTRSLELRCVPRLDFGDLTETLWVRQVTRLVRRCLKHVDRYSDGVALRTLRILRFAGTAMKRFAKLRPERGSDPVREIEWALFLEAVTHGDEVRALQASTMQGFPVGDATSVCSE